jgi:hypothetical protein
MSRTRTTMTTAAAVLALCLPMLAAAPASARMIADPDPETTGGGSTGHYEWDFPPPGGFDWKAPNRYEQWGAAWRQRGTTALWPVETYRSDYVNPTSWGITVMGCQSEAEFVYSLDPKKFKQLQQEDPESYPDPDFEYRWTWNGQSTGWSRDCFGKIFFPAEGTYNVTLQTRNPGGDGQTFTKKVEVKDILIVVLGDSSASGEGAPDVPLPDAGGGRARWIDNRCHRSKNAGGAQAARRIENGNDKTSVTFLSFACSGATLSKPIYDSFLLDPYNPPNASDYRGVGITGPYAGIEPIKKPNGEPDFTQKLPSQIDQLWNALTDFGAHPPRKIDVLIVAGGINDARFADLAGICVLAPFCYGVRTGVLGPSEKSLHDRFNENVGGVPAGWDAVGEALDDPRPLNNGTWATMSTGKRLALQYPPFFHDDEGDQCKYILHQSLPEWAWTLAVATFTPLFPPGWTVDEISHANDHWAPELDRKVKLGAERNNFTYVDTIADRFFLHGICADDRYINNPVDSTFSQGDSDGELGGWWVLRVASLSSKGTAHPNIKGYSAYADEIIRNLPGVTKKDGNNPPAAKSDKVSAVRYKTSNFNVLANDTDLDSIDVLSATIATQPSHGDVTMKLDGSATYKPRGNYVGKDYFYYEVTDGTDVRLALVEITVRQPLVVRPSAALGRTTVIGGLLGGVDLAPPFRIEFAKPFPVGYGDLYFEPDDGLLYFDPPPVRRRRIRLDYTIFSETQSVTSPSYGDSVRGRLILRVKRQR